MKLVLVKAALATAMMTSISLPTLAQGIDFTKHPVPAIDQMCREGQDPDINCDCVLHHAEGMRETPAAVAAAAQLSGNDAILRFTKLSMSQSDLAKFETFMINIQECGVPGELPPPPPE